MEISSNKALDLWKRAILLIQDKGRDFADNDNRTCRELFNLVLNLEDVDSSGVDEPIKTMIDSKKWVYPSKEELSGIMFKEFQAPIYEYTYGGRIFGFNETFDQINSFVIPLLSKDPSSRRAVLVFYDPVEDSKTDNKNTPGIIYVQFRIIDDRLNMNCHIRSNDLFFGWPANVYQLFCLMDYVSKKLDLKNGSITTFSNSAHVFVEDFPEIEDVINF
jgi:thymidylate synthase (methanogen type)